MKNAIAVLAVLALAIGSMGMAYVPFSKQKAARAYADCAYIDATKTATRVTTAELGPAPLIYNNDDAWRIRWREVQAEEVAKCPKQ